jgi:hypothetical protein
MVSLQAWGFALRATTPQVAFGYDPTGRSVYFYKMEGFPPASHRRGGGLSPPVKDWVEVRNPTFSIWPLLKEQL